MTNEIPYTILVVVDNGFKDMCSNPDDYVKRLKVILGNRIGPNLSIKTVDNKYGLTSVDDTIPAFKIDSKNKTLFIQTIENISHSIDELLIISIIHGDPFLEGLSDSLGKSKRVTRYSYIRKEV